MSWSGSRSSHKSTNEASFVMDCLDLLVVSINPWSYSIMPHVRCLLTLCIVIAWRTLVQARFRCSLMFCWLLLDLIRTNQIFRHHLWAPLCVLIDCDMSIMSDTVLCTLCNHLVWFLLSIDNMMDWCINNPIHGSCVWRSWVFVVGWRVCVYRTLRSIDLRIYLGFIQGMLYVVCHPVIATLANITDHFSASLDCHILLQV